MDEFGRNGWACAEVELEASEFGSSALRLRKYFVGFKCKTAEDYYRLEQELICYFYWIPNRLFLMFVMFWSAVPHV